MKMPLFEKEHYRTTGLLSAIVSFILLFMGVRAVLGNEVGLRNIVAFLGFSIAVGLVASCLTFFKMRPALIAFLAGLAVGFLMMYRSFLDGTSGWGDLVGIISLLTWVIIGLCAGLLIQLSFYLYRRYKRN